MWIVDIDTGARFVAPDGLVINPGGVQHVDVGFLLLLALAIVAMYAFKIVRRPAGTSWRQALEIRRDEDGEPY